MADKIDPYDVAALERSLNDSATRVSTIWVSYLVFGLYLATATGNVSHRQLFLEEPIKLAVLNIDLPLVGFFVLAPMLFVIFHLYVLLQLILLARTAVIYNEAIEKKISDAPNRARVRQRLSNTLFAQIFAGAPRERQGLIGNLLHLMAWITLAIAPILVLLTFELKFLPYHSHPVTWIHRVFIVAEIIVVFLLWPGILNAKRDISWKILTKPLAIIAIALVVSLSWVFVNFPGESHSNWTRYLVKGKLLFILAPECKYQSILYAALPRSFDRLSLSGEDMVDDEDLIKMENATKSKAKKAYEGERTRSFRERDLNCGDFSGADLRRSDFTGAQLVGASFIRTELQGAQFRRANLQGAFLLGAQMQGSSLTETSLNGANLADANLQAASFNKTELLGAELSSAHLQGAYIFDSDFRGATLLFANLAAVDVVGGRFNAANLRYAHLESATIRTLYTQDDNMKKTFFNLANLSSASLWRAQADVCAGARVINPLLVLSLESDLLEPLTTEIFIEQSIIGAPESIKLDLQTQLKKRLDATTEDAPSSEKVWRDCAARATPEEKYVEELLKYLTDFVCGAEPDRIHTAIGVIINYIGESKDETKIAGLRTALARAFLGLDGKQCAGAAALPEIIKDGLRRIALPEN